MNGLPPDAVILAAIPAEGISTMSLVQALRKKRRLPKGLATFALPGRAREIARYDEKSKKFFPC